jgi:hypothetical protein
MQGAGGDQFEEVVLPSHAAGAFLATMIAGSAAQWAAMYEGATALGAGAFGQGMIEQEKAQTARNVSGYLDSKQMQVWNVPVVYAASVDEEDPALRPKSEADVLRAATSLRNMQISAEPATLAGPAAEVQPTAGQASVNGAPAEIIDGGPAPAWVTHVGGLSLVAEGVLAVRATDAASAAEAAKALLTLVGKAPQLGHTIKLTGHAIQHFTLEPPSADDDSDHERFY